VGRYLDGLPVAAHREAPWETVARLADRYRVLLVLVVAYLLMRVAVLAVFGR